MRRSKREQQGFLSGLDEQILQARLECYDLAQKAETLEEALYWWAAVFHGSRSPEKGIDWSTRSFPANTVRQILDQRQHRYDVHLDRRSSHELDNVLYSTDLTLIREVLREEKKEGKERTLVVENRNPQLHELPFRTVLKIRGIFQDILATCTPQELRFFAYILVKEHIDTFLDLFTPEELGSFNDIIVELYRALEHGSVTKKSFVGGGSKRTMNGIIASFRKKVRPILLPKERGFLHAFENKISVVRRLKNHGSGRGD